MKTALWFFTIVIILYAPISNCQSDTMLTISEILFSDTDPLNTFIELYNTGTTDISLDSTVILYKDRETDSVVYRDSIKKVDSVLILHPKQYAVILNHDYKLSKYPIYKNIPPYSLTAIVATNFCKETGLKNAIDKKICIYKSKRQETMEVYISPAIMPAKNFSIEKINLTKDNSLLNWTTSRYYQGTPGCTNSVTVKNTDAMLVSLSTNPEVLFVNQPGKLIVGLYNNSLTTLYLSQISLYKTASLDSITVKDSLIFQSTADEIASRDTIFYEVGISPHDTGLYNYIARVSVPQDEDSYNDTISISFHAYTQTNFYDDVVLNELMYAPATDDMKEWIEIYNRRSQKVNLKKWKLCDPSKQLTITNNNVYIQPHSFYVIAKDTLPANLYPPGTPILITSFPSMNNNGDFIAIRDSFGLIIDSVTYSPSWGGEGYKSLERIFYDLPGNDSTNWGSSRNPRLCTPGFTNSLTPKEYDIDISSFSTTSAYYSETDSISLSIKILNRGMKTSGIINLNIYNDGNHDYSGTLEELLFSKQLPPLSSNESDSLIVQLPTFPEGKVYFIASVAVSNDNDTSNNYRFTTAHVLHGGNPRNKIVINEMMYASPKGEPEWIELYNRSAESVNLKKFSIADDADTGTIAKTDFILDAGGYCIVSRDSSILKKYPCNGKLLVSTFPTLNNDYDKVILLDSLYRVIDSLAYSPAWSKTSGASLERILVDSAATDSSNWSNAVTRYRATPGYCNSVTPKASDISVLSLSASPHYPTKGDSVTPYAHIYNNGTSTAVNIRVTFSFQNEYRIVKPLMDTVISSLPVKDSIVLTSSQLTSAINDSLVIHVLASISADEDTSNDYADVTVKSGNKTGSIVINEIMFNPRAGFSEWIELYNTTKDTISINGWRISDILSTPTDDTIKNSAARIPPFGYLTISRDTLPVQEAVNKNFLVCRFGMLNNSADGVVLRDSRGSVIDSVFYNSNWDVRTGKSLERLSASANSCDSLNWLFSFSSQGCTPGAKNSVDSIQAASPGTLAINEIMYEPGGDNAEFVELYNTSSVDLLLNAWKITTANKNNFYITDSVVTLPPHSYFVVCSDSVILKKYPAFQNYRYKYILQSGSLGLLNSNSSVVLRDAYKNVIDSVYYRTSWHNPNFTSTNNRSLERINPILSSNDTRNWSSSANKSGATPGETNSIFIGSVSSSSQMSITPNPFSPDNDGYEDFTSITFQTPYPVTQISIKIFDDKGRLMRELTSNEIFGSSGTIIYDGRDKNGNPLRLGMYIVLFEAVNPQTGAKQVYKKVLVSARKL